MIKIGCAGYPVRTSLYQQHLQFVEIGDRHGRRPKDTTIKKWRQDAPDEFEFVFRAPSLWIDPIRSSGIRWNKAGGKTTLSQSGTPETELRRLSDELKTRIVLFELPSHFHATPDRITRFQNLVRSVPGGKLTVVWTPPKDWPDSLVERLSHSLKLVSSAHPLKKAGSAKSAFFYYRVTAAPGTRLTDENMKTIKRACQGKLSYVTFDLGPTSFSEAMRFSSFAKTDLC